MANWIIESKFYITAVALARCVPDNTGELVHASPVALRSNNPGRI
jgi:hypothetical protein